MRRQFMLAATKAATSSAVLSAGPRTACQPHRRLLSADSERHARRVSRVVASPFSGIAIRFRRTPQFGESSVETRR